METTLSFTALGGVSHSLDAAQENSRIFETALKSMNTTTLSILEIPKEGFFWLAGGIRADGREYNAYRLTN
jgi:hypothetical protein